MCTKRNPEPPCDDGYLKKLTTKGVLCCYKAKPNDLLLSKNEKNSKKKVTCTKRNPEPPCDDGFIIKKNKKGDECCYKNTKQNKSKQTKQNKSKQTKQNKSKQKKGANDIWKKHLLATKKIKEGKKIKKKFGVYLTDNKSFWSYDFQPLWSYIDGHSMVLFHYGKIGTGGKVKVITYKDEIEALAEVEKLEHSKIKKGYKPSNWKVRYVEGYPIR